MAKKNGTALAARDEQRRATRAKLLAKKPRTAKVLICLDDDLVIEREAKIEELEQAVRLSPVEEGKPTSPDVARLERELQKLNVAVEESTVCIVFRGVGGVAYEQLINSHQPTEKQKKDAQDKGGISMWNPETFPVALIHASIVEPDDLELEDVEQLWREWNAGERVALFNAALDVNTLAREVADTGNAFGGMPSFMRNLLTASRSGSLTPSS